MHEGRRIRSFLSGIDGEGLRFGSGKFDPLRAPNRKGSLIFIRASRASSALNTRSKRKLREQQQQHAVVTKTAPCGQAKNSSSSEIISDLN